MQLLQAKISNITITNKNNTIEVLSKNRYNKLKKKD